MTTLTEGKYTGEFVLSEGNGSISREQITVSSSAGALVPGTVLGKVHATLTAAVSAAAGNTGDGALPTVTVANGTLPGRYTLTIISESADAGGFRLEGPNGALVGTGNVAAAFAEGGISFTLADGAADYDINDRLFFDVTAASVEWVAYDKDNTDGSQYAAGILYAAAPDSDADQEAVAIVRMAEVVEDELTGIDATGKAHLLALGIVCR